MPQPAGRNFFGGCGDPHPCSLAFFLRLAKFPVEEARKTLEKLLTVYAVTHLRMIFTPTLIGYEELTTIMESIG